MDQLALVSSVLSISLATLIAPASATVTVSNQVNQNIRCSGNVCVPTAKDANLNVKKLEKMLATSDVKISTGSGKVASKTRDIVIDAPLRWSSPTLLVLDCYRSTVVDQIISVSGTGALTVIDNDGGIDGGLSFGSGGAAQFSNLSSALTINGVAYALVSNIGSLASAVAANPDGSYALANNYDASGDGAYVVAAVPTTLAGNFEGLGNRIFNLSITDSDSAVDYVGMFSQISSRAVVENINLVGMNVNWLTAYAGGLAGYNAGHLSGVSVSGSISGNANGPEGGLVGENAGRIEQTYSAMQVTDGTIAGGLVGINDQNALVLSSAATGQVSNAYETGGLAGSNAGTVQYSYSTGNVSAADNSDVGGLIGVNSGMVEQSFASGTISGGDAPIGGFAGVNYGGTLLGCYALGSVNGQDGASAGGFLGSNSNNGKISEAYSIGNVSNAGGGYTGGFLGFDDTSAGNIHSAYWDTDTSGINNQDQGAGNIPNDPGITGLTSAQLQTGLPRGFKKKVWSEDVNINDGFPYLLALPPN
ncbi:MAG TPA: hypothetical protein VGF97_06830 [Rhizomicrobium sp.]|jgi:hypothetical protein